MRLPRTPSGWTIAVFGLLAFLLGLLGLVSPGTTLEMLGFEVLQTRAPGDYTLVYMAASSMAAVNMGVYYMLASAVDFRPFFLWTVPFRLVTFTVFTTLVVTGEAPAKFLGVGLWEGAGALITGAALWWESRRTPAARAA
ncbi:hypothetical protein PS9374_02291 [Planomonospora sphaerica]|uniref:Uncharacterized protein n=1 Tax=Planomonospora sphaerica TaxID=161355 RepID=A0A171CFS6_9ACTN|nr:MULTISPECIES: hypothetical protein [Planomonospora]GAT66641.1 hypothetical protein PS9374_02291 [Planomonospora sphaerica]GGL03101.1 hypothetical protein GCM10014719_01600 [Planomonospora parontospora subsp. antibiotica]GII13320.1 hypothetical protein Ppa05_00460 [Planomonospora parontospora subsp. antibiotica]